MTRTRRALATLLATLVIAALLSPAIGRSPAAQAAPAAQPAAETPAPTGAAAQPADAPHTVYLPQLADARQRQAAPPLTVSLDGGLRPAGPALDPIGDSGPRPLAAVADPAGRTAVFVANELVVQTDDRAALDALLARYAGRVLLALDPAGAGMAGLPRTYLVRIDPARGDPAELAGRLTALAARGTPEVASGAHRVSGADGAGTLAIAAGEALAGAQVGVNWVGDPQAIPGSTREAGAGPTLGGTPYTPDAYRWTYMARGGTQDIGVAEAWSLLARSGRLGNRVPLAILDKGFAPTADFPSAMRFGSVVPGIVDARGVRGDSRSPWHGTHVLVAAAGRADNGAGAAGVAPTADPIAIYTGYDYIFSIAAVILARAEGAKVINMSYSANVPAIFAWTAAPFEATTAVARAGGALLFASAGNDGQDVDGEDCFGVCWEHTLHTPCENAGVICVGGLGWDSRGRDGGSNFGARGGVPIFAPYTVYRGADPDTPGGDATLGRIDGTSFASPFAAGVAALVWAADPSLGAEQVWAIMRDTAHTPRTPNVPRYVNAFGAVLRAVGSGVTVTIGSPVAGRVYEQGAPIPLDARVGFVAARAGIPLDVQWRTAAGRVLRNDRFTPGAGSHSITSGLSVSDLPAGEQTVIVRATAGAAAAEARVSFSVRNTPPRVALDQPLAGAAFCYGESVTMRGSASDVNQPAGLPASAFAWRSSRDGALGAGPALTSASLSAGEHTLTLRVTDAGGASAEASVGILVRAASDPSCLNLPPSARITSPANGATVYAPDNDATGWFADVTFRGVVGDDRDAPGGLRVEWRSDIAGDLGATMAADDGSVSVAARLYIRPEEVGRGGTRHTITLRVTDGAGNVREDRIEVLVAILI